MISEGRGKQVNLVLQLTSFLCRGALWTLGQKGGSQTKHAICLFKKQKNQSSITEAAGNFRAEFQRGKSYTNKQKEEICWKEQLQTYELTYSKAHSILGDVWVLSRVCRILGSFSRDPESQFLSDGTKLF